MKYKNTRKNITKQYGLGISYNTTSKRSEYFQFVQNYVLILNYPTVHAFIALLQSSDARL